MQQSQVFLQTKKYIPSLHMYAPTYFAVRLCGAGVNSWSLDWPLRPILNFTPRGKLWPLGANFDP
jgi:hypothetical protein